MSGTRKPTLSHRAEYFLMRAVETALSGVTANTAGRVGSALGALVRTPLGIRRDVVESNLRLAFPEADDAWIERTSKAAYRHLGREAAAMLRLSKLDPEQVRRLVEISPAAWTAFEESLSEGRGVVLATGHYGNWEMAAAAVAAHGVPIDAIVKRQSNPLVDRRIQEARAALGVSTVDMREAARRIPRALLSGHAVGIVADQDARRNGVWVPFFGTLASTHRGPAVFALRLGSPLFAAVARRLPDGRYFLDGQRIDTTPTDSFEDDVVRLTAALAAHLESEIRKDPTQYFWFHKRWKTRPPEEPLSREAGTTTRTDEDSWS